MAKGRPQTSIDEKRLAGTLRADRLKNGISFTLISKIPEPPKYIGATAKTYYTNLCNMLIEKNMLYNSDVHLLIQLAVEQETYEQACGKLKTASSKVKQVGKDNYEQQSPWIGLRNNAAKNIREIGALFGLDPLSRTKFAPQGPEKESNPFDEFLKQD